MRYQLLATMSGISTIIAIFREKEDALTVAEHMRSNANAYKHNYGYVYSVLDSVTGEKS